MNIQILFALWERPFGGRTEIKEMIMIWITPTLVEICIGLEINGFEHRQRAHLRQERSNSPGRPFTGREQRDRNGSSAREGENSRRPAGYARAAVAGSDPGQRGAGHQLLPFTGLGRASGRRCGLSWQALEHQSRWRRWHFPHRHGQESQDPSRNRTRHPDRTADEIEGETIASRPRALPVAALNTAQSGS